MTDIQVGDIVFIESQSSQSPYIKLGTMSKWTHCGVVVDTPDGLKAPVQYKKYLGQPYDLEFRFDNGKMYCSELVWLVYKDQGIELCDPRKVSSFVMARVPKVKKLMQKRNIRMDQEVVAPVDIYKARRIQASCSSSSPEIR